MFRKIKRLVYLFLKFPETLYHIQEKLTVMQRDLDDLKVQSKLRQMGQHDFEPARELQYHYEFAKEKRSDINFLLPLLYDYASKCKHITEMGVRTVVSTYAFLSARPERMVSIDMVNPEVYGEVNLHKIKGLARSVGTAWSFVEGSTLAITIEPTELLFIDTLHTYDQVKGELERHHSNVSKYILFHDTITFGTVGEAPGTRGLNPAIDEFLQAHPEWKVRERITFNNGLTVLEKA